MVKKIGTILLALCGLYIIFCLTVYFFPEMFFYNPTNKPSDISAAHQGGYQAKEVHYKSADGTDLLGWYTKPVSENYVVLFLHGNSYNVEKFYQKMLPLAKAGYGTFMAEYRGFGGIKGEINQKNLEEDAIAAVNYLKSLGYENDNIIVYGMSLGSHMAINTVYNLQKDGKFASLLLEVPFDSLHGVIEKVVPAPLPIKQIVRDKYDNMAMIDKIDTNVLIMGGSEDPTVPIELAENLFAKASEPKTMLVYNEAKHNNLYDYKNYEDIIKWLE